LLGAVNFLPPASQFPSSFSALFTHTGSMGSMDIPTGTDGGL